MKQLNQLLVAALLLALPACQPAAQESAGEQTAASGPVMMLPLSTDSAEAKASLMKGLAANDAGRIQEAREHFLEAVEADPGFASGHLWASSCRTPIASSSPSSKRLPSTQARPPQRSRL